MYWCIGALILVAMSGTAFHWYLTNGDAKREMLTATLLAMLSAACSVAVGELVSLFHFVAPH
jgi:quinol-cytochrome oxidoreductase complex cytochrome b subunit